MKFLGIDTGGTFTDFVLHDGQTLRVHKVLSTPEAPERAILRGMEELGIRAEELSALDLVHGSTVATNAVLEGKGVATVLITNRGLADLLSIGRQTRTELYALQPLLPPVPVPPERCLEVGGRHGADGRLIEPLTEADLSALVERVTALGPRAVAINLLFSFLSDELERRIEAALPGDLFISRSSEVLPEYREYERGVATWLNAWVGPLVEGYLARLHAALPGVRVAVMQSSGDTVDAAGAGHQAVRMLLSGPAGGLAGAQFVAARSGLERLLTFDMGGTSTDVALLDGRLELTSEGRIGPYPVAVPMVDMHTIGAGGGSIASVDAGGLLQVGPESAGASPGPACYGLGGTRPTVTDANLVLGRLLPEAFLGGGMGLDATAARAAVATLAQPLGVDVDEAALGIIRLANEHMARALRVMSVQRGTDPRQLTLVSFGGAGGLHVCALAEALGMRRALVPVHAGVLSALGMLAAPRGRQLSRTYTALLETLPLAQLESTFAELAAAGIAALGEEGVASDTITLNESVDLRYAGQAYTLNVPWSGVAETTAAFHAAHALRFGHRLAQPVELVTLRLGLRGPAPELRLANSGLSVARGNPRQTQLVGVGQVEVWQREALVAGQKLVGPALVVETVATTYLAPGWRGEVSACGNLLLEFVA